MTTDVSEKAYQRDICSYLESTGYVKRTTKDYNVSTCLDVELVLKFIQTTQEKDWDKYIRHFPNNAEENFINSLVRSINNKGAIEVLRNGFRDASQNFKLFYPKPNNNLNPDLKAKFQQNIFSVIDELEYENRKHGNRLDLVIFINGIPISTIELKDTFSQGVEKAIKQYKEDRNPREPIFQRSLVHFAMSDDKIYMTTKLKGKKTKFLPFNKGIENPEVKNHYKTSYLYMDILQPNHLSKLINNFIFKEDETLIFPRFHQLDCVKQLLKHPKPGKNYLIKHSAGSGKTKTIAWLAHGLLNKFNVDDERIYDMVIVVSDRKVIDSQLQQQVKAIEKKDGVVQKIDENSKQLAEAIKSGSNIVVTTLHKFSFILDEIGELENRNYAVIVDEAHSSQTGSHARNLRRALSNSELDEDYLDELEEDIDKELYENLEKARNTNNLSFFAFTATPKNKTLEMFGYKDKYGQYWPYHSYSMEQAIEEGFILDVLENYITYPTYFKLVKTVEDDPEFDSTKSKKVLKRFVDKHPHSIHVKTGIMLDHFRNSTIHKIKNQAKAMVVTSSRKQAVLYKLEFDRQIRENNLPFKTLVAFTGSIEHDAETHTENSLNDIGNMDIKEAFKKDDYKILIVADKYQTGFDEPLLHTMYVDKKLNGVKAVQTLSRVNRIYPNKKDTLILDFVNNTEDIRDSFEPFYKETFLSEETDYHKLYDLMENIYEFYVFDEEDVNKFVKAFYSNKSQIELHNMLNSAVEKFRTLDDEKQAGFKKKLNRYQNLYSFLSQLLPFSDLALEKLFIYNKFLNKKLPTLNNPLPFSVLEDVDIHSYKVDTSDEGTSISLTGAGKLDPSSGSDSQFKQDEKTKLSEILDSLNKSNATDFAEEDRVFVNEMFNRLANNEDLINKVKNNSKESVSAIFGKFFNELLYELYTNNKNFFYKITKNEKLSEDLQKALLDALYEEQND